MSEMIADYKPHHAGEREVVNWTRPGGQTYFDIPVVFVREVTADEYLAAFPHMRGQLEPERCYFWEVSVD